MSSELFIISEMWPEVAVEAIYRPYPRKSAKGKALEAIRKALDRIASGEIDGKPRTAEEAITFLRNASDEARQMMYGRQSQHIPHPATYFNGRRYLRKANEEIPKALEDCISILNAYPSVSVDAINVDSHMPVLRIIGRCIECLHDTHGTAAASYIRQRVYRFTELTARWDPSEMQFIPGAKRFFEEKRYEWPDSRFTRKAASGFEAERSQLLRIVGSR